MDGMKENPLNVNTQCRKSYLMYMLLAVVFAASLLSPGLSSAQTKSYFIPNDYEGFVRPNAKHSHDVTKKSKKSKNPSIKKLCVEPLTGLDYVRAYTGAKTCPKSDAVDATHQLRGSIDFAFLVDDTKELSGYLETMLDEQEALVDIDQKKIVVPKLLKFKGAKDDLEVLVVGEQYFRNISGNDTEKENKWFLVLEETLKSDKSDSDMRGLRESPLTVSRGNREAVFKSHYHKCAQDMVLHVKHREFGLDRIGGPEKRCINKKNRAPKLDSKPKADGKVDRYNRWEWYKDTGGTFKIKDHKLFDDFKKEDWYKKDPKKYSNNSPSNHATGRGIDYFTRPKEEGKDPPVGRELEFGDQFRDWIILNSEKYNVEAVIWNKKLYSKKSEWKEKEYTGGSGSHHDHLHVDHSKTCK